MSAQRAEADSNVAGVYGVSLSLPVQRKRPSQLLKLKSRRLAPIKDHLDDVRSEQGEAQHVPFCGSGTTIIAAEITGRSCYAVELMPLYVDVALKRWEAFTGGTAKLESDGRTFAEITPERRPDAKAA